MTKVDMENLREIADGPRPLSNAMYPGHHVGGSTLARLVKLGFAETFRPDPTLQKRWARITEAGRAFLRDTTEGSDRP